VRVPEPFDLLPKYLAEVDVSATPEQLAQFRVHYDLLLRWNAKTNLTSVREPAEILRRHIAESAYLTKVIVLGKGKLVDVGTGAGFPGIPVKILSPETSVVLIEAVHKKAAFLKEVARELGVPALEVRATRLEDLPPLDADWLTMRAVRLDREMMTQVHRHVPRGTLSAFLGEDDATRLSAPKIHPIPGSDRRVIAVGECSTWNIS
jgi:16S rRNA (guanine527-N7)-methyltransferase